MADQLQLPLTPIIPPATQAAIEAALIGHGYHYQVSYERGEWFTLSTVWSNGEERTLNFLTGDESPRILLIVEDGTVALPEARAETAILLAWINARSQLVTFQMAPGQDQVEMRFSLVGELGAVPNAEAIDRLIEYARWYDDRYLGIIRSVASGACSAEEGDARVRGLPSSR